LSGGVGGFEAEVVWAGIGEFVGVDAFVGEEL
jgi:hypothetical protein